MHVRRLLAVLFACTCWIAPAHAQRATERYVPIGRSPGLSGVSTVMGSVETVDPDGGRLTLRSAAGPREVEVDDSTRIWLDRSALGETNLAADLGDCRAGRSVEVKIGAGGRVAEWIKIRAPASP
jgi:hypothetical protein